MCRNRSTKQKKQVVSYQQLVMELDLIFIVHGMEGGKDRLFFSTAEGRPDGVEGHVTLQSLLCSE